MLVEIGLPVCGICSIPWICTRAALQLKKCKGKSESESTERDSDFQVCLGVALGFFVSLGCSFFVCVVVCLVCWLVCFSNQPPKYFCLECFKEKERKRFVSVSSLLNGGVVKGPVQVSCRYFIRGASPLEVVPLWINNIY